MMSEYVSAALDLDVTGPEHTRRLALALADCLKAGDVLLLSGELGAGKTTFTRSLGEGLGVREGVISPTFVLSRVHPNLPEGPRPGGPDLVHVDAYRLSSAEELDDLDLEFSMPRSVTVIEWGRDKAEHLSDSRLELDFTRLTGADARFAYSGAEEFSWDDEDEAGEGTAGEDLEDLEADVPEPRLLRVRAFGPRWEGAFEELADRLRKA
ncbi:tRNA (adenosine(37)-N6)-threonylcarbamoyltransferase complex ATPase subunit type 1 TsaE [uncultured Rothia sp.]|uniref:tRNA (adenosine(37)-N6)-threonylcarbamoyltransferase complex ATPase subunit type 1 TsaE n=1 Tax=uncultured Rothia sp. TaxID=316088 RepID=UPI0025DDCF46|nr:tRNA (adenosine(37)-N6)-threonylcarbamoyltransferase complex ATPase subunit type 1 TsaE [uncultured Rothia sp.]